MKSLVVALSGALVLAGLLTQQATARPHPPVRPAGRAPSAPPHVQPFATQLAGARAQGPLPRRPEVPVVPQIDGCDHAYGGIGQCVPWTFPAGVTDRCGWLRAHGLHSLPVRGKDRQHLDPRHTGTACPP
ncbi:MAG TPA: hypothetical protein VNW94_00550 [Streptosporangiaceae bacterium]|nr:hypothetical protein [Streptosporangiaceae bacterium]